MSDDKYFWSPGSGSTIQEYIKKFRPSIITDNDTPWIWVKGTDEDKVDPERTTKHAGALVEAERILHALEVRMTEIEADDGIPTRAKKGQQSKKAVREEAHEGAKESLKNLSKASKWTVGKWLMFPQHDTVDGIWSTIAQSVAEGPLKEAGVGLAKVAPTPSSPGDHITHVICMYMDDIYDLSVVRKVLITLLQTHGIEPSAVKSDLYTLAGIDSNHPTKLRSSIWRPSEVVEGGNEAIKRMKEEFRAQKKPRPSANDAEDGGQGKPEKKKAGKVGKDGIIESDSEDERITKRKAPPPPSSDISSHKDKEARLDTREVDGGKTQTEAETKLEVERARTETPVRHKPSRALKFKEQDIFAGGSDSE